MSSSSFDKNTHQALQGLKLQLKASAVQASVKSVPVEEPLNEDELFKKALQGVTPLTTPTAPIIRNSGIKKPTAQILAKRAAATGADNPDSQGISDTQALLNPVASEAMLSYRLATLQHRVFDQLKSGKLRWFEAVDLHGCTVEQAREAVLKIIEIARTENQTVIKIVHGKGPQALLKTYVNGWLRQHREVLAFVSAPTDQGGTGAVLVLLKRAEQQNDAEKSNKAYLKR
jgi:DNA-nicking Smr family endonuclease